MVAAEVRESEVAQLTRRIRDRPQRKRGQAEMACQGSTSVTTMYKQAAIHMVWTPRTRSVQPENTPEADSRSGTFDRSGTTNLTNRSLAARLSR
jgi:hypothetical protein